MPKDEIAPGSWVRQATFRIYAELNDCLPGGRRQTPFTVPFHGRESVKDLIESLGVPHTEVDLILVNGRSVDFSRIVEDGDRISVYPVFEAMDISPLVRLRPAPLRTSRFVLDVHLGRLASWLRFLGFDARYSNVSRDDELARISSTEKRILLTHDRGLLKRREITHGYWVRARALREQMIEVVERFDLAGQIAPFSRCSRCNEPLVTVPKNAVADRLPARVAREMHEFRRCRRCGRIYWKGSHHRQLRERIDGILASATRRDRQGPTMSE